MQLSCLNRRSAEASAAGASHASNINAHQNRATTDRPDSGMISTTSMQKQGDLCAGTGATVC